PGAAQGSETLRAFHSRPVGLAPGELARALSVGTGRQEPGGTVFFSNFLSTLATPALRKYFCAMMSVATCDQAAGTAMSSSLKTTLPSGLRISLVAARNSIPA